MGCKRSYKGTQDQARPSLLGVPRLAAQLKIGLPRFLLRRSLLLKWKKGKRKGFVTIVVTSGHLGISASKLLYFY